MVELAPLEQFLADNVLSAPPDWREQTTALYDALVEVNQRMNLTRITSEEEFLCKHMIDSLLVLVAVPELAELESDVLDLGCGGGFPGLPLAIFCPLLRLTEMDGTKKKVGAVQEFIYRLGLENATAVQARGAEWAAHTGKTYHAVLARAVKDGAYLVRECRRLLKPDGMLIAYKTPAAVKRELADARKEAKRNRLAVETSDVYTLPGDAGERQFMLIGHRA